MKKLVFMLLLASGMAARAQSSTSTSGSSTGGASTSGASASPSAAASSTSTGAATTAAANDTPANACKSMVENAKNKNFDAFMKMTTDMPMHEKKHMKETKNNYQKMQSKYLERLQDLSCGNEIIAQDHAMVESESKGEKRLVPFVKTNEGWKFDMKTYQSFYHTEEMEHGKKM